MSWPMLCSHCTLLSPLCNIAITTPSSNLEFGGPQNLVTCKKQGNNDLREIILLHTESQFHCCLASECRACGYASAAVCASIAVICIAHMKEQNTSGWIPRSFHIGPFSWNSSMAFLFHMFSCMFQSPTISTSLPSDSLRSGAGLVENASKNFIKKLRCFGPLLSCCIHSFCHQKTEF